MVIYDDLLYIRLSSIDGAHGSIFEEEDDEDGDYDRYFFVHLYRPNGTKYGCFSFNTLTEVFAFVRDYNPLLRILPESQW